MNIEPLAVESIDGYSSLSEYGKKLFKSTYTRHIRGGCSYGCAIKVKEERKRLRVDFENGEYLYYYPNGTWG